MYKLIRFILFFALLNTTSQVFAEVVLYDDGFSNYNVWEKYSGGEKIKEVNTDHGTFYAYNISFYPYSSKTYTGIEKVGYLDFRKGSSTVTTATSYLQLPDFSFVNGGTIEVVYGAGSTNKKMQLQEWNGTEWINGKYAVATTIKSSTWYTQKWNIEGTESKRLRLVLLSSGSLYVTNIKVTTNSPCISTSTDTLNIDNLEIGNEVIDNIDIEAQNVFVSSYVIASSGESLTVSNDGINYLSSMVMNSGAGTINVKFDATSLECGLYEESIHISAIGTSLSKSIVVKANVVEETKTNTDEIKDDTTPDTHSKVYVRDGQIVVENMNGFDYQVYDAVGRLSSSGRINDDINMVDALKGLNIIKIGTKTFKIYN